MLAWHFLSESKTLGYHDGRKVRVGRWMTYKPNSYRGGLVLCESGMHGSKRLIDALKYAPGPIVCRVEMGGQTIDGGDKIVAEKRRVIWMLDATEILHEFGCRCAEKALKDSGVEDERCWSAISVKRRWVKGYATDEELDASHSAADSAAYSAAHWAARWAADSAAHLAALWAARWASHSAADSAAYSHQNRVLTAMVSRAKGNQ